MSERCSQICWPEGKSFAFTIFDDPDSQSLEAGRQVYGLLRELGLRTTKGVWPVRGPREPSDSGWTCADPGYAEWARELQEAGFEIGLHNVTSHTSLREETAAGLDQFERIFGHYPRCFAQHYSCAENLYWGDGRLSAECRLLYNLLTRFQNRNRFHGHIPGHPEFWGDLCQARIQYVRSFVFEEINTLKICPFMPYHDPVRPYVNYWYASSEGSNVQRFNAAICEANQDRLEAEGGACIMYTHFGHSYCTPQLNSRFVELIGRLSKRNGWFVPVSRLLDYLLQHNPGGHTITPGQRKRMERRWLLHKIHYGTA
jgi:hypothetical protein